MSVLIEGMEMPKSCYKCYLKQRNGMDIVCPVLGERFSIADVNILYYRLDNCPLVNVPPHGRLADLDKIENEIAQFSPEGYTTGGIRLILDSAPTIIPAEEGKT